MYDDVSQLAEFGHFEGPGADYFVDPIITIITVRISLESRPTHPHRQ